MSAIIDDNTTDMAMEETLISPRFYKTNYKELDKVDISSVRHELDQLIEEMVQGDMKLAEKEKVLNDI